MYFRLSVCCMHVCMHDWNDICMQTLKITPSECILEALEQSLVTDAAKRL